jgi:hypothetical protein
MQGAPGGRVCHRGIHPPGGITYTLRRSIAWRNISEANYTMWARWEPGLHKHCSPRFFKDSSIWSENSPRSLIHHRKKG